MKKNRGSITILVIVFIILGVLIYLPFANYDREDRNKDNENSDVKKDKNKDNENSDVKKDKNKDNENSDVKKDRNKDNENTSNSLTYYDDSSLDQEVHENIKESMMKLNSLTSQDIKEYKVNTQVYNQDRKPNVIITVDCKGVYNEEYSKEELKWRTEHIYSNFTGNSEIQDGFSGYFNKLYVNFKKDGIDVGKAEVKFNDTFDPKVKINKKE